MLQRRAARIRRKPNGSRRGIRRLRHVSFQDRKCESTKSQGSKAAERRYAHALGSGTPRLYLDLGYGLFLQ